MAAHHQVNQKQPNPPKPMAKTVNIEKMKPRQLEKYLDWIVEFAESRRKGSKLRNEYLGYAEIVREKLRAVSARDFVSAKALSDYMQRKVPVSEIVMK